MRWGVVGCGMMGVEHILNLALIPEAKVVALADPVADSLATATRALGRDVPTYPDVHALLAAERLDAVVVASPNHTHRAVLEPLLAAPLHILAEKPLATSVADARWIVERAAVRPPVFWTAMEYRFMPPVARFVAEVHAGTAGPPRMLAIREHRFPFLPKVGDWNRFAAQTGGTMVEKSCHFFDLMRLILRAEPVRVFCSGGMDVNHLDERYDGRRPDIIDNGYTVVDFDSGARAMLDLCMFADGAEQQEELVVTGDKARLRVVVPPGELEIAPRAWLGPKSVTREVVPVEAQALAAGHHWGATYHQHLAFAEAARAGGAAAVTAHDGLMAVAIGAAAELSAREKRVVAMVEVLN